MNDLDITLITERINIPCILHFFNIQKQWVKVEHIITKKNDKRHISHFVTKNPNTTLYGMFIR